MTWRRRSGEGQSLVEVALILPMLILLVVAVFDLGRAVYAQHTIGNAARGGARVAIVNQAQARIEEAVRTRAVGLDATKLPPPTVGPCTPQPTKIGCEISVTVSYTFEPMTPLVGNIVGPMTLQSTTRAAVERVYTEASP